MTEDQIERRVEARVDLLDSLLMSGRLTQAEYDEEMKRLNDWAEEQYRALESLKKQEEFSQWAAL